MVRTFLNAFLLIQDKKAATATYDMNIYKQSGRLLVTAILFVFSIGLHTLQAQEVIPGHIPDTILPKSLTYEQTAGQKKPRNLRYSILGGPSFTPDYGLLLGGSALLTFRMNAADTAQLRLVPE